MAALNTSRACTLGQFNACDRFLVAISMHSLHVWYVSRLQVLDKPHFTHHQSLLAEFLKILHSTDDVNVKVQLIQTLSMLVANTKSTEITYYLLSNNYINELIKHPFDFNNEELLAWYISFLKALSLKLDTQTIQFFFNEQVRATSVSLKQHRVSVSRHPGCLCSQPRVLSITFHISCFPRNLQTCLQTKHFPLYTEAMKFIKHPESMVQIAVDRHTRAHSELT